MADFAGLCPRRHTPLACTKDLCRDAGVKLVYLPPSSPDLNLMEEYFSVLKAFIRKRWSEYEENQGQGFKEFLEWCVVMAGNREGIAEAHFRHAGVSVEEF